MKKTIILLLVLILISCSFSVSATTYYVNTTGNDTTGDGSSSNPYASLYKANIVSRDDDSIIIGNGIYTDYDNSMINIQYKNLTIIGEINVIKCLLDSDYCTSTTQKENAKLLFFILVISGTILILYSKDFFK